MCYAEIASSLLYSYTANCVTHDIFVYLLPIDLFFCHLLCCAMLQSRHVWYPGKDADSIQSSLEISGSMVNPQKHVWPYTVYTCIYIYIYSYNKYIYTYI